MAIRAHTVPRFYLRGFVALEAEGDRNPYVWVGSIETGEIARRDPKNLSTVAGYYDGPGGFASAGESIEAHLARIENAAATAIRKFTRTKINENIPIPPEISRFLSWQAARTPGWHALEEQWANDVLPGSQAELVEPPPAGFETIAVRSHPMTLQNPDTRERIEIADEAKFQDLRESGWIWILTPQDRLESLHLQAWYFQTRHFPRLKWTRLQPSDEQFFITSDRAVAWIVDGYADTPPAALKHPQAQVIAPLTRDFALLGRHNTAPLRMTPRDVNRLVAFAASNWIAGPTYQAIAQALDDRKAGPSK